MSQDGLSRHDRADVECVSEFTPSAVQDENEWSRCVGLCMIVVIRVTGTAPNRGSSARRSRILNTTELSSRSITVGSSQFEDSARMTVEAKNEGKTKERWWSKDREGMSTILGVYNKVWYQSIRASGASGRYKCLILLQEFDRPSRGAIRPQRSSVSFLIGPCSLGLTACSP